MKNLLFALLIAMPMLANSQTLERYYAKPDSLFVAHWDGSQPALDSIIIALNLTYSPTFISFGKAFYFVSNDTIRTGDYITHYVDDSGNRLATVHPNYSAITPNKNVLFESVFSKSEAYAKHDSIDLVMTRHDADSTALSIMTVVNGKISSETDPLFNTKFATKTTDNLTQGSTNKYVTATNISNWNTAATLAATAIQPSGNAATATKLATARTINGTSFDGSSNISITATPNLGAPSAGNTFTSGTAFQVNSSNPSLIIINASLAGIVGVNGTITVALCSTQSGTYTTVASDAIAIAVLGVGSKSVGTVPVPSGYWVKITLGGGTAPSATYTKLDFQ